MVDAVSRELILPAIRLDVPSRPSGQQIEVLTERSADQWSTSPLEWTTQQVTRLAVAEILRSRLVQAGSGRQERQPLPTDPAEVTLAQLAALFRPHVGLAGQAFELAVIEAVNAGVPATSDPLREGLRRIGVTGREPMRMIALGLEKLPARARPTFWEGLKASTTLTAVIDALASGTRRGDQSRSRDVSGLDRSQLARADALVVSGGRMTPVSFGGRARESGASWLHVPVSLNRRHRGQSAEEQGRRNNGERAVEVSIRGESWVDVFETALDAVASAMQQIDLGGRPRGRSTGPADALALRLVAAKQRTVADVCASLRAIDPFCLELFDHQVTTSPVPVAVPVVDDDLFVQLWLPTSALAGPLFTGAPDLFMGGGADYRLVGGKPAGKPVGRPGPASSAPQERRPREGGRSGRPRGGKGRPGPKAGPRESGPAPDPTPSADPSPAPDGPPEGP